MNVHDDAPWKAPDQRFMDVSIVKKTEEDGLANRVASRREFQPSPLDRPARSSFSLCILTLANNLHFEFYRRSVTDEMQSPWNLRIDVVSKRLMTIAKKIKNTVLLVIGFRFHSNTTESVGHDTLWLAC